MRGGARVILGLAVAALAGASPPPARAAQAPQSLQGDTNSWRQDPRLREFYALVRQACANGCDKADVPALEAKSRGVFGRMAAAHGMSPRAMQDHLAVIPRQMVQIGRDDPAVLQSYDAFLVAMFGPE